MPRIDSKHLLRKLFGQENCLRQQITIGTSGMLITGLVSSFENYISTLHYIGKESNDPERVMGAIEYFSDLSVKENWSQSEGIIPADMMPGECDDLIVLRDVLIQYPSGQLSPIMAFWFGKLSAVDFWTDPPIREYRDVLQQARNA